MALLAAAYVPLVQGHGGHDADKIPEGETVSPDPIVRLFGCDMLVGEAR
jgi:hypothetical protein